MTEEEQMVYQLERLNRLVAAIAVHSGIITEDQIFELTGERYLP